MMLVDLYDMIWSGIGMALVVGVVFLVQVIRSLFRRN